MDVEGVLGWCWDLGRGWVVCDGQLLTENLQCIEAGKKAGHVVEVEWWAIDHADLKTVSAFAQKWLDTGKELDILCSNIGMGGKRNVPEEQAKKGEKYRKTVDGFEEVHSVCNVISTPCSQN